MREIFFENACRSQFNISVYVINDVWRAHRVSSMVAAMKRRICEPAGEAIRRHANAGGMDATRSVMEPRRRAETNVTCEVSCAPSFVASFARRGRGDAIHSPMTFGMCLRHVNVTKMSCPRDGEAIDF
ncbi:hypothetical protein [Burkholderia mayonis]|uniref:hypothetical protein n=1 Tax=Burkholderia mayonis TaxID=1385591 RepID=UPI000A937CEE|nr:hypothetical protein [Burkholderia mayonis]